MAAVMTHSAVACTRSLVVKFPLRRISARRIPRPCVNLRKEQAVGGRCYAAVVSREDRSRLLTGVDPGNVEAVSRVVELARRATDRWEVSHSDFLSPAALSDALLVLRRVAETGIVVSGGYAEAERCRVSVGNAEAMSSLVRAEIESTSVAAVGVSGNFKFDAAGHGDFLGAVLNTGIVREKVGDIIVNGNEGSQVLVVPEIVRFLCGNLTKVRGVSVEVSPISLSDLITKVENKVLFKTFEASLRVDAVASAGFKISRTKLAESMSGGSLSVNWKVVTKSGAILKSGDVVSLRGHGRIEIGEINTTKKGRYGIELFRFV